MLRLIRAALLVDLLVIGCERAGPAAELAVTSRSVGGRTTLTLTPGPGVRINARVALAVELTNGTVFRLSSPRISADSAYFTAPPTGSVASESPLRGIVHASICREDEAVCRLVVVPLPRF